MPSDLVSDARKNSEKANSTLNPFAIIDGDHCHPFRLLNSSGQHLIPTDPGGLEVERSLGVRKVVGSIPSRDIPKVVKRRYKQLLCLRSALKGECLEIWLVGPVSAYNVTGWGGSTLTCLMQVPLQND